MAKYLLETVYRERRRMAFVTVMAFLAGFIFYLRSGVQLHGVPIAFLTGAIYAAIIGPVALLVCLFLPSMRFMIEAVAVSRLLLSFFVFAAPATGYAILASPALTAFVIVAGGAAVSRVMHGRIVRERAAGWRGRLMPANVFRRVPVRVDARPFQQRFVHWMDGTAPIPA